MKLITSNFFFSLFSHISLAEVIKLDPLHSAYSDFPWYSARYIECLPGTEKCDKLKKYSGWVPNCQLKSPNLRYNGVAYSVQALDLRIVYDDIAKDLVAEVDIHNALSINSLFMWTRVLLQGTNSDQTNYLVKSGASLTYADGSTLFYDLQKCAQRRYYDYNGSLSSNSLIGTNVQAIKLWETSNRLGINP